MIKITQLGDHQPRMLNPDLIEYIETVPETMIVMVNGHRYMVSEPLSTILDRIVAFRRQCRRNRVVASVLHSNGAITAEPDACERSCRRLFNLSAQGRHARAQRHRIMQ